MTAEPKKIPIRELGEDHSVSAWKDYRAILPAEEFDESTLLDLLADDSFADAPDGPLPWVPLHAWRALGQMGSVAVIEPVLRFADSDLYPHAYDDFEKLSEQLGESAIDPLIRILEDRTRSETSRTLAAKGLGVVGRPAAGAARQRVVDALMNQIRRNASDGWVNGMSAEALMAMGERSVGAEVLKMQDEGRLRLGFDRAAVVAEFFGQSQD